MIERTLLGLDGSVLLHLWRWNRDQALRVKTEALPDLQPIGTFEELPGLGRKIFIGDRRPRPGTLEVTLGTHGRTHDDLFALQRELLSLVPFIAGYSRNPGGTLEVAGVGIVKRTFTAASAMLGGTITLGLECASPYFWQEEQTQSVPIGSAQTLTVAGVARTGLMVVIRAGSQPITNPGITTDAGVTGWLGTIPAQGELVIDNLHGGFLVTLNGQSAHLKLTGPFPHLEPGHRSITITAPGAGATATLTWKEGEL